MSCGRWSADAHLVRVMSTPEEDLVLVWESGRRVDHNYAVGAGGGGFGRVSDVESPGTSAP